jgi:cytochrome c oxidase subunit 2
MMRRFIRLACAAAFALPVEAASPLLNEGGKARRYETDRVQLVDGSLLRTTGTAHPVHEIQVVAKTFAFEPETIEVGSGEAVRLVIRLADRTHGFAIPALEIDAQIPKGGAAVSVEFVPPAAGRYEIACSEFCGVGHGRMKVALVAKDGSGVSTPVVREARLYNFLTLSPDGERSSVMIREGPSRNIWTDSVSSGLVTRLTFGKDDTVGLWSPDGARLVYSPGAADSNYNLFSIATDGSRKAERLTHRPHTQIATSVSPSGDTVLFNDADPATGEGGVDVWAFSLAQKKSEPLLNTRFDETDAVFSPHSPWIAYVSDESGREEVYELRAAGCFIRRTRRCSQCRSSTRMIFV